MKPICFPFSHVPRQGLETLVSCFGGLIVYLPSRLEVPESLDALRKTGQVEIRVPIEGDEGRLKAALRDFKNLGGAYRDLDSAYLKARAGEIPFFDENAISRIRSEVRKKNRPPEMDHARENQFSARLFLQMAQEFDGDREEIRQGIVQVEQKEQEMIQSLLGEGVAPEPGAGKKLAPREETAWLLISQRIMAWGHLLVHDPKPAGLIATISRDAFEWILEKAPEAETILSPVPFRPGKGCAERLISILAGLVKAPWVSGTRPELPISDCPGDPEEPVSLTVSIIPGQSAQGFFSDRLGIEAMTVPAPAENPVVNTLVVLIE